MSLFQKFKKGLGEINDILLSVGVTNANYNRDIYPYARLSMYIIKQRTD